MGQGFQEVDRSEVWEGDEGRNKNFGKASTSPGNLGQHMPRGS